MCPRAQRSLLGVWAIGQCGPHSLSLHYGTKAERFPTAGVPGATHSSQGWNVNSSLSRRPTGCSFPSWTPEARSPGQERDSELSKHQVSGWGWPVPGATQFQHLHCSPTPGVSSTWVRTAARHPVSYDQTLSSLIWSPKGCLWSQRVTRYTPAPFELYPFAFCQSLPPVPPPGPSLPA